jgi:hypothetical protein
MPSTAVKLCGVATGLSSRFSRSPAGNVRSVTTEVRGSTSRCTLILAPCLSLHPAAGPDLAYVFSRKAKVARHAGRPGSGDRLVPGARERKVATS